MEATKEKALIIVTGKQFKKGKSTPDGMGIITIREAEADEFLALKGEELDEFLRSQKVSYYGSSKSLNKNLYAGPGAIYRADMEFKGDSETIYSGTAKYVRHADAPVARMWAMEEKANQAAARNEAAAKKFDPIENMTLGEMKEAYRHLSPNAKAAFVAQLVKHFVPKW